MVECAAYVESTSEEREEIIVFASPAYHSVAGSDTSDSSEEYNKLQYTTEILIPNE